MAVGKASGAGVFTGGVASGGVVSTVSSTLVVAKPPASTNVKIEPQKTAADGVPVPGAPIPVEVSRAATAKAMHFVEQERDVVAAPRKVVIDPVKTTTGR